MKKNKVSVIYVRFSAEDNEDNNGARSIENQIKFLTKYANDNNFTIVKIYSDIGKTGTNMNRPGLQELYSDMNKGLFNTIIVKDLSRFSRNYIEAGNYLEYIFPASNIRFISVLDNYDSANKTEDESIILRNFLNSMYSKDIKKKIHKSLKRRVNSDDLTFVVKYGFKRDEKGKIVIDEYSANIVRRIFTEAIEGINAAEIARRLEKDKIYTPSAYKKFVLNVKPNRDPEPNKLYKWDTTVIRRMLGDLEYCGYAVNIVKRKSRVIEEQNIVIKNKRPIIIDEDTFNKAPKYYITRPSNKKRYMKSLIYCKTCGKLMYYHETKRKDQATYYCCNCHTKIDGDMLKELLYKDATEVLKESKLTPDEFLKKFIENHSGYNKHHDIEIKLKTIEKEIQITFENNMQGKIKPVDYLSKMKQLNFEYSILEQQLEELPTQIDIKLLQYKYYEFIKNIDKEIKDKDEVIKSTIKKVHVDLTNKNPIIDIVYIFE